jgi:hypothetical protein
MPADISAPAISIPYPLEEAIKSKRAILFIGAGASKESRDALGHPPPDADQLRDILAMPFLESLSLIAMSWPSPKWQSLQVGDQI